MKYSVMLNITRGLLTGDVSLPQNQDVLLGLLEMAFSEIATKAESLHLLTTNRSGDILRLGTGKYLVRTPKLPENPDDELDIDHELCFAAARIIASYISAGKGGIHANAALRLILDYNSKVFEILETMKFDDKTKTCTV